MTAATLSEFAAHGTPTRRFPVCWFQRLTDDQRERVTAAREAGYAGQVIAKVVGDWGMPISSSLVSHHFTKRCKCP